MLTLRLNLMYLPFTVDGWPFDASLEDTASGAGVPLDVLLPGKASGARVLWLDNRFTDTKVKQNTNLNINQSNRWCMQMQFYCFIKSNTYSNF